MSATRSLNGKMFMNNARSQGEKTKLLKDNDKLNNMVYEMEGYKRNILHPRATEQVEINIDNGVKENYNKLGNALKKVVELSAK